MNLRAALLPFLFASSSSSSSSSSSHDDNQHDASASSLSSSSASSSASDIQDSRVSMNDDAYGGKKKLNPTQQRNKLHLLHDPSPSSELTNRQDHPINVDGSTRSDASKNQDIGYLDHRRLSEDPPSDEASQRHRELETREAYCEELCKNSERPEIQVEGTAFQALIEDCITDGDDCPGNNVPIGCWNTIAVTDMSRAFYYYGYDYSEESAFNIFNEKLNCWDVAKVTDMTQMFDWAKSFNQPLNDWNVAKVVSMRSMLYGTKFNQPVDDWNVAKVTNMNSMFYRAYDFDQPLNDWNVARVTTMNSMFKKAASFNQPVDDWNVAKVNDMSGMFNRAYDFDQPLNDWNVAKVVSMRSMLYGTKFNQPVDDWNVANVTDMGHMFQSAQTFNQCILSWAEKTSSLTTGKTYTMFAGTQCPISSGSPDPDVGPWCQGANESCFVPTSTPTSSPTTPLAPTSSPTTSLAPTSSPTSAPTLSLVPTSSPTTSLAPTSAPTTTKVPTSAPTMTKVPTSAPTLSLAPTSAPTSVPTASPTGACKNSAKFDCDKHVTGFKKRKCSKKIKKKWGVGLKFRDVCQQMCKRQLCTCVDSVEKFSIKGVQGDHTCAGLIGTTNCKKFTGNGFAVNKICPNQCRNTNKCINAP